VTTLGGLMDHPVCAGRRLITPVHVSVKTATGILMDIVTILRLTAAPTCTTTAAASVTPATQHPTPTPRASTLEATTTTVVAIISRTHALITRTTVNAITDMVITTVRLVEVLVDITFLMVIAIIMFFELSKNSAN